MGISNCVCSEVSFPERYLRDFGYDAMRTLCPWPWTSVQRIYNFLSVFLSQVSPHIVNHPYIHWKMMIVKLEYS